MLSVVGAEFSSIPYNSCNLGSINLKTCVENGSVNHHKLYYLVSNAVRFLDNMITINKLPLEKISDITKSLRSVGLGTMGLADMLYMLKIPYDSQQSLDFVDGLYESIRGIAIETSIRLAKEKGKYPAWDGSVWQKSGVEVRNSNFLSIAPNGSISFIANTSGSIEPNFALVYTRRTNEGDLYYLTNECFKQELEKRGLYSEELLKTIAENNGSCVGIKEIPKDMQEVFIVASDIKPKQHADVVANIQRHVDLAISKTINLPYNATIKDVEDIYMYAWENNIKGITVYRDGCRDNQTLSTSSKKEKKKDTGVIQWGTTINAEDDLIGRKKKVMSGCGSLHILAWYDSVDGRLMEIYLNKGSLGVCSSFMTALSRMMSAGLRTGLDFDYAIDQLKSAPACPSYSVRSATKKDTSKGNCCPAAVANALIEMRKDIIEELGLEEDEDSGETEEEVIKSPCPECGEDITFASGCLQCNSCGWSRCS